MERSNAFRSEAEARKILDQLTAIGRSCGLTAHEDFVVLRGLIIESDDVVRNEVLLAGVVATRTLLSILGVTAFELHTHDWYAPASLLVAP